MGMELIVAAATVFGVTVVPLGSLLFGLHTLSVRARAATEQRRFDEARVVAKKQRRQERRLFRRLDHLDACLDGVRDRVERIEAGPHRRRATDAKP